MQAYLDTIKVKIGKTVNDFRELAAKRGLAKRSELMDWLKADFDLGHGHANAMAYQILNTEEDTSTTDENVAKMFQGNKAAWRATYDTIMAEVGKFGSDISVSPTMSYISLLRRNKKFAIVQPSTPERLDLGIKLKGAVPTGRFEASGAWNNMVTHRVRISDPAEVDGEVFQWLKQAYEAA